MRLDLPTTGPVVLFTASIFFGSSALFIRFATEASAISLTFFRLSIAAVAMVFFALSRNSLKSLGRGDLLLVVLSGSVLSLHFAAFILAVKETTVANATFLVNTSPIMLAVMSPLVIRERTTSREAFAVLVATLGILLVAHAGNGFSAFGVGDLSAILAAFLIAVYSLVGRYLRTSGINTACYTSYVYAAATFASLAIVGVSRTQTFRPYDTQNVLAILGLGIVPTALGHTLYNYALGSVKTVTANLFPLMEPIIASLFAVVLFGEVPTIVQAAGYFLILAAVVIVARSALSSK
jgi:drug/metabolite transporter (DMT)-like permease